MRSLRSFAVNKFFLSSLIAYIAGNMDPVSIIRNGTPDQIRQATQKAHHQAAGPFYINAGCEIPPGTPPENLHALCQPIPA